MKDTARPVGALVIAVGLLAGGAVFALRETDPPGGRNVHARFRSVVGLVNHADVTYKGVKVGDVSSIRNSGDGRLALLSVQLLADAPELKADASLTLRIKSLLGELYLDLDPGKARSPLPGDTIEHTGTDMGLDSLLFNTAGLLEGVAGEHQIRQMSKTLQESFNGRSADLQAIFADSRVLLAALADRSESLGRIMTNLDQLTRALDGRADALGEVIDSAARLLVRLREQVAKNRAAIDRTVTLLRDTLARVETGKVAGTLDTLPSYVQKTSDLVVLLDDLVNGRKPVTATVISIPDLNPASEALFRKLAEIPWIREPMIGALESVKAEMQKGTG